MFGKTDEFCTTTFFIGLLYLVTFTADMGLLTTMIAYFMVELRTILRYKFLRCMSDNLPLQINIRPCQQETNGEDCGIYAVANAFYVSSGTDAN